VNRHPLHLPIYTDTRHTHLTPLRDPVEPPPAGVHVHRRQQLRAGKRVVRPAQHREQLLAAGVVGVTLAAGVGAAVLGGGNVVVVVRVAALYVGW
jgi:hypothetical protein